MTKTRDAREDFIRGLRPSERLRSFICDVDVAADGRFEFARTAVNASAQLLFRQRREPAFDKIHPRSARGSEVDVEAGMTHEPAMNRRRLMRAGVVHNEMDVQRGRDGRVDGHEELAKLPRAVPLMKFADDFPTLG